MPCRLEISSQLTAEIDINGRGRNQSVTREDNGPVQVANPATRPPLGSEVSDDGQGSPQQPEPLEDTIHCTGAEDTGGSNDTPDDRSGKKDAGIGACISILLIGGADTLNRTQCPVEYSNLDDARPRAGNGLGNKGDTGLNYCLAVDFTAGWVDTYRDLHIMAQLHVLKEKQAL